MKVLIVSPVIFPIGARYSGIERLAGYWAGELSRQGQQVTVVAARGSFLPRGVNLLPVPQGDFDQGELVAYGRYRYDLKEFDLIMDFSHSHRAMREFSLPALCWVWHDPGIMQPALPDYNVAALSQWQANRLQIYQNIRARVVDPHCGIGREPVEPKDAFSFVGKMHPTKGALEAIQLCRETTDQLYIIGGAGPGDPPEYLEQVRQECHGLATYWGEVNDPVRDLLLASTKALIYPLAPDYAESHSHKSVDALLCGCAVISYWRGALPEVIEHGRDGFLARTREEFKTYMKQVNTLNRQEIRHRAVERWSVEKVVARTLPLLQEVVGGFRW